MSFQISTTLKKKKKRRAPCVVGVSGSFAYFKDSPFTERLLLIPLGSGRSEGGRRGRGRK